MPKLTAKCSHFAENDDHEALCIMSISNGRFFHLERQVEIEGLVHLSTIGYYDSVLQVEKEFSEAANREKMKITLWRGESAPDAA